MAEDPPALRAVLRALSTDLSSTDLSSTDLSSTGSGDRSLLEPLARTMLRRAPGRLFAVVPPPVLATRVTLAFEAAEQCVDAPVVRIHREPGGTVLLEVVSPDRRFLLSTLRSELDRRGVELRWSIHPIVGVARDEHGRITEVGPARHAPDRVSVMHLDLAAQPRAQDEDLLARVRELVELIRVVSDDHQAMQARLEVTAMELRATASTHPDPRDALEVAALLDWILEDNLVLLGVGEYAPAPGGTTLDPEPIDGGALGLLRHSEPEYLDAWHWPPDADERHPGEPGVLTVTRTRERSRVQRDVRMEVFAITMRRPDGSLHGQLRVIGLLTRKALSEPVARIPVVRRRLAEVLDLMDAVDGSHDAIDIASLLQAFPKDELLRSSSAQLHLAVVELLAAEMRQEPIACVRCDRDMHTAAVIATIPTDRWDLDLRRAFVLDLRQRFATDEVDVDIAFNGNDHVILRALLHDVEPVPHGPDDARSAQAVSDRLLELARTWTESVASAIGTRLAAPEARRIRRQLLDRMPRSYQDRTPPTETPADLLLLDAVAAAGNDLLVAFRRVADRAADGHARLLAAKRDEPLELSAFLPIVESLGLRVSDELPHELDGGIPRLTLHDLGVSAIGLDPDTDGPRLADAIQAAWRGHLEVDPMNRLVLAAGLDWRDVGVLRSYRRLRRQIGTAYTPAYVDSALAHHPLVVRRLIEHFHARFDPGLAAGAAEQDQTRQQVLDALDDVTRLDHDRILRGMLELIDATLRTNAFRPDAVADVTGEPYIAFKIDPSGITGVPEPVPHREIFVHSPRVEGVHLRAGAVARGGLRWSDRRDDVRTEVLDLVKAQTLKNAVIVPTGAKGGFVLAHEPDDPAELREEVRRQYITFVRGLLDVTDDLEGEQVVGPPDVIRHDDADPYLVVAADRGTAALSDTANAVAHRYGFWLDDAFASGGSQGYDHKALGVTARGAWVAVTRHFRELGLDVATDPISVAGVGDMSGDVFGNGLLRSRAVRLLAAFDHRHVFLDPDPDPAAAFAERRRLFDLPRSSWDDYDRAVLSEGGMIVPRAAKQVTLSDAIRDLLRVDAESLSPPELIRAILRAPVDLLFAGGIGTYIKGSTESHADIGDRANDELRVDATEVRARVVCEGANLFATQRARIELARRGSHLNQDAVDNAAGVATSDLEVNIKILLRLAEEDGLIDRAARNALLEQSSEDVVALALRTVDRQAAAISREIARGPELLHAYGPMLTRLETEGDLDRTIEVLPDDAEIESRIQAGAGLTRPEIATLVAWAKRRTKEALLASDVPDAELSQAVLDRAFPQPLVERFPDLPRRHRLRRELIATGLANDVVDRMGATFVDHLVEETGVDVPSVVRAFELGRRAVSADRWWDELDALESLHDPTRVRELEAPLDNLLASLTRVLLADLDGDDPEERVDTLVEITHRMLDGSETIGTPDQRHARSLQIRRLVDDMVDPDLARLLASTHDLALVPDIAAVHAGLPGADLTAVADTLLRLGDALGIDRLEQGLRRIAPTDPWTRRQRLGLTADLRRARRTAGRTAHHETADPAAAVRDYLRTRSAVVDDTRRVVTEATRVGGRTLDALAVGVRAVTDLVSDPTR